MKYFIDVLREQIVSQTPDGTAFDLYKMEVEGWPEVVEYVDDGVEYYEPIDLENWAITSITRTHMNMWAEGHWQDPCYMVIALDPAESSDKLRCIHITHNYDTSQVEELEFEEIINLLETL